MTPNKSIPIMASLLALLAVLIVLRDLHLEAVRKSFQKGYDAGFSARDIYKGDVWFASPNGTGSGRSYDPCSVSYALKNLRDPSTLVLMDGNYGPIMLPVVPNVTLTPLNIYKAIIQNGITNR